MLKPAKIFCMVAMLCCGLALALGCPEKAPPQEKSKKIVSKKIVRPKQEPGGAGARKTAKPGTAVSQPSKGPSETGKSAAPAAQGDRAKAAPARAAKGTQASPAPSPSAPEVSAPSAAGRAAAAKPSVQPPTIAPPPPKAAIARSVKEITVPKTAGIASPTLLARGYDPEGKVNPFEALFRKKTPAAVVVPREEELKCPQITPLQKIALSQLKLTGIILAAAGNRALVEESSGKGYVLEKGTDIGPQCGTVVAIERDRVLVEEKVKDVRGKIVTQTRELKLQKPPGEI